MRFMFRVEIPTEGGNQAIQNGKLPEVVGRYLETYKPESTYFTVDNGHRTMYSVVNMDDASDMPAIGESFFLELGARINFTPVMTAEDLKKGLAKVFPNP